MTHQADVELARRAAAADPVACESVFADAIDRVYAFVLRRTPSADVAQLVTERVLTSVFRELGRYEGRVPLSAWVLSIVKRELRSEARATRPSALPHASAPPPGSVG
jgi:DNA-directed RNA polymerase specialized sigma24 family protein